MRPTEQDIQRMVNAMAERVGFLAGLPGKTISERTSIEVCCIATQLVHAVWPVACSVILEAAARRVETAEGDDADSYDVQLARELAAAVREMKHFGREE